MVIHCESCGGSWHVYDRDDFYSLPYSRVDKGSKAVTSYFMAGLGGHSSVDGKYDSSWLFPIFSHNAADETFVTPLCYSDKDTLVTPIYGHTKDADWLLPLYYHGTNTFITPLFGAAKEVNWAVPLYWQDENTFLSLAWSHYRGPDGKLEAAVSPLLLSGYNRDRKTGDSVAYILAGLAGRVEKADGTGGSWAFPLYYKDAETFFTLLYGHTKTSEWLFPLYYREGDTMLTLKLLSPTRLVKNALYCRIDEAEKEGASKEDLLKLVPPGSARRGIFEDDIENGEVEIGQIASAIKAVHPVAEVMKRLVDEFHTVKEKSANF